MNSREKILATIKNNQPPFSALPSMSSGREGAEAGHDAAGEGLAKGFANAAGGEVLAKGFAAVLTAIGGSVYTVSGFDSIARILKERFAGVLRLVTNCPGLPPALALRNFGGNGFVAELERIYDDPHSLEDIDLSVLSAHFGVAENGACWITEDRMLHRVVPFICQHLVLVLDKKDIVANMHEAYDRIAALEAAGLSYGFATFIAGPSKTADIEQSLVLGAHGPVSMTVFLLDTGMSDEGFY